MTQLARQDPQQIARPAKDLTLSDISEMTGYELPQIAMIRHNMATSMRVKPDQVPLYDIALYCHSAKTLDLDPLLRQCYWIVRQGKGALQVGIDGYRAIAERSGIYAGSQAPEFRDWFDFTENNKTYLVPGSARVTVWKIIAGRSCAFTGEAYWDEWYPGSGNDGFMYRKMPRLMLAKDAEAQALRKAFPAMLSKVEYASAIGAEEGDIPAPAIDIQEVRPQPRPRAATAADYDRIIGSNYDDEREFGTPSAAVQPPAAAEAAAPAEVPNSTGATPVTTKDHPLWKAWLAAEKKARQAGFEGDTSGVHLGISESELQTAIDTLLSDVEAT